MPFRIAHHKRAVSKPAKFSAKLRLQVASLGALCLGIGMLRVSRGTLYVVNFYSMQAFSGAIVAIGAVAVLVALLPVSWIEKLGKRLEPRSYVKDRT